MALTPFNAAFDVFDNDPFFRRATRFPFEVSAFVQDSGSNPMASYVKDSHAMANTMVDVKETEKEFHFIADLPGLKREEVKVQVEDGSTLMISGERTREEKKDTERYHRVERSTGKFLRRFKLPGNADVSKISANSENGVLTVTVPKVPPPEPKKPVIVDVNVQ